MQRTGILALLLQFSGPYAGVSRLKLKINIILIFFSQNCEKIG